MRPRGWKGVSPAKKEAPPLPALTEMRGSDSAGQSSREESNTEEKESITTREYKGALGQNGRAITTLSGRCAVYLTLLLLM